MHRTKFLLTAAAVLFPTVASAQSFGFQSVAPGAYSSVFSSSGSQTLTVTPDGVSNAFVIAEDPFVALLGSISLIVSKSATPALGNWAPMRFTFLNAVSSITFAFGDNGGDDDSPARISAYDASNVLLGVFDTPYPAGDAAGATNSLTFGGAGAQYFVLSSGSTIGNDDSIFWEVTASTPAVTATPEPASLALMGTGLAFFGVVRRRRRAA